MTHEYGAGDLHRSRHTGDTRGAWTWQERLLCLSFILILAVMNFLFHNNRTSPVIFADELGYISAAKYFSGDLFSSMINTTFYHFGYAVFLVPFTWMTDNIALLYRLFLTVNTMFSLATFLILANICIRMLPGSRLLALTAAFSVSIYFPVFVQTSYVWTPVCLSFFFLFTLWLLALAYQKNSIVLYLLSGLMIGFLYAIHPTMLVAIGVGSVLCVLWIILSKKFKGIFLLPGIILSFVAVSRINKMIAAAVYMRKSGTSNLNSGTLDKYIDKMTPFSRVLKSFAGQLLNSFTGTAGLFFIGIFALVVYLIRMIRSKKLGTWQGFIASFFFLTTAGTYVLSILSMTDGNRWDHLFYGRYVDQMIPAYILAACLFLAYERRKHKVFLFAAMPLIIIGLCGILYVIEPDGLLRTSTAWQNAVPMTLAANFLPELNFIWLAIFCLIEYAVLLFVIFAVPAVISRFVRPAGIPNNRQAAVQPETVPGIQQNLSDDQLSAVPGIEPARFSHSFVAGICGFMIILNLFGSGYVYLTIASKIAVHQKADLDASEGSADNFLTLLSGQIVGCSPEYYDADRFRFYTNQYAWNCQLRISDNISGEKEIHYFLTNEPQIPIRLFGMQSYLMPDGTYLCYYPDIGVSTAKISGIDLENRVAPQIILNKFSYDVSDSDRYLAVKTGAAWNPYYSQPEKLGLKLQINKVEARWVSQVGDTYYFEMPGGTDKITSMKFYAKAFSAADFGVSQDETKYSISVDEITAVAEIPVKAEQAENPYVYGDLISFSQTPVSTAAIEVTGFHNTESSSTWTSNAASVAMTLIADPPEGKDLLLTADVFRVLIPAGDPSLDVNVLANGQPAGIWQVTGGGVYQIRIPSLLVQSSKVKISFDIPKATSPQLLGMNSDSRILGIGIKTISLTVFDEGESK